MMSETKREASGDFVATPLHNLVAAFHSADSMNAAVTELEKSGVASSDIRSFVGPQGMKELDFDGSAHGSMAELLRYLQHIGPDRTYLERYEKYMQDGDGILMVYAPEERQKNHASEIIRKHSVHRMTYFGTLVIEEV